MREEGGFLGAILADPWDEITRGIYADWLEERGDRRGAYLRAESAVNALGFEPPLGAVDVSAVIANYHALRDGLNRDWLARVARPDWVLVWGGGGESVAKGVCDASEMWDVDPPSEHDAYVHELSQEAHLDAKRFGIRFVPPLAPNLFCDLIGWLADARYNEGVIEVFGWLTSPHTGTRYVFTVAEDDVGTEYVAGRATGGRPVVFNRARGTLSTSAREDIPDRKEPRWTLATARQVAALRIVGQPDGTPDYPAFLEPNELE